ncbi:MAG: InlB B-repeat-containing protein, partial [Acholeplasmatales bacterium]|nr:InlB B-repeat-containing protein [Acholeplasmatales bacterium]
NTSNYVNYNKTWTPTTKGKVQIIFRFHQWQQGTNIVAFNNLPAKYNVVELDSTSVDLPQEGLTFTINDSFVLSEISVEGYEFVGWFIDSVGSGEKVTEISLGTTGDLHLYAKWLKLV